jgi:hypothetical protein
MPMIPMGMQPGMMPTQAMGAMPGMMPMGVPMGMMPPPQAIDPDRARQRFTPCAQIAIQAIMAEVPDFRGAVLVIAAPARDPRMYVPIVVVSDGEGNMRSLEPPMPLLEACQRFVFSEYEVGALFWVRLEARVSKKPQGGLAIAIHLH